MALTDEDKQWIHDQLEGVETKLLTAFHSWVSPADMQPFNVIVESLEDRVKKIEAGR